MTMQLIKKTETYSIFKRGDDRYAVQDAAKKPVNGDEKAQILLEEGLITMTAPAAPAEPEAVAEEEAPAEDAAESEAPAEDTE
jgi:hypothetical protein